MERFPCKVVYSSIRIYKEDESVKRMLLLILAAMLALGLFGCGKQSGEPAASSSAEADEHFADLDAFYAHPALGDFADIRTLSEDYSQEQAQADGCFVIGVMVYNDGRYDEFMERCQNGENAFIRVAQSTVEGDLILTDLLYDSASDQVLLVHDSTRDAFSAEADRIITLHAYEATTEFLWDSALYWIAYNGSLDDIDLSGEYSLDQVYVIAHIN